MADKAYKKVEHRVNEFVPDWKEWPRRLRRIYASLEEWGSTDEALEDAIQQWGWDVEQIKKLAKATPSYLKALEAYRFNGDYPRKEGWKARLTTSELKTVYMREGELTSFAALDENPKAITFHSSVVAANGMLDMAEPYGDRDDIVNAESDDIPERPTDGSGLLTFDDD